MAVRPRRSRRAPWGGWRRARPSAPAAPDRSRPPPSAGGTCAPSPCGSSSALAGAACRARRGALRAWRGVRSSSARSSVRPLPGIFPCGDFGDGAFDVLDEVGGLAAACFEEPLELLAARRLHLCLLGQRLVEGGEELVERALDAVELAAEEDERAPDVLQRHPFVHQRLDQRDAADGGGGIEPARTAVLALLADASAAGQKPELHVLTECRLRELHAFGREEIDDLHRADPLRVLLLQRVELVGFALRHPLPPMLSVASPECIRRSSVS